VRNIGQQLATQAVGFLKRLDLLLAASQAQRRGRRLSLFLVQTDQLTVGILQLSSQGLSVQLRGPPA
jgi:hypothetical protein